jgi:hypothetical protein
VFVEQIHESPVKIVVVLVAGSSDEIEVSTHKKGSVGSSYLSRNFLKEGPGSPMIAGP